MDEFQIEIHQTEENDDALAYLWAVEGARVLARGERIIRYSNIIRILEAEY